MNDIAQITESIMKNDTKEVDNAIVLTKVFAGYSSHNILSYIDIKVGKGELWIIIGPSGAGKTTLFKVITELLKPKHGTVEIDNQDLHKKGARKKLRGKIGYIPQNLGLISSHDVKTNIHIGSLGVLRPYPVYLECFRKKPIKKWMSC